MYTLSSRSSALEDVQARALRKMLEAKLPTGKGPRLQFHTWWREFPFTEFAIWMERL